MERRLLLMHFSIPSIVQKDTCTAVKFDICISLSKTPSSMFDHKAKAKESSDVLI